MTVKPVWPETSGSVSIPKRLIINIIAEDKRKNRLQPSYSESLLFYARVRKSAKIPPDDIYKRWLV